MRCRLTAFHVGGRRGAAGLRFSDGAKRRAGFTLIELLVVVAIIALLLALILPSLARARERAKATVCLSNVRTMAMGSLVYASENNAQLPGYYTGNVLEDDSNQWFVWWYGGFWSPNVANPNAMRVDVTKGSLYPYFKNPHALVCPSTPPNMVAFQNPTNPLYPCPVSNYGMNNNAASTKIGLIQNPATVSLFTETAQITYGSSVAMTLHSLVEYDSTANCLILVPNMMGVHNKMGAVSWADGHATLEAPYYPDPAVLTGIGNSTVATFAVKNLYLGFLTPCPQSEPWAQFIVDPQMNSYCVQNGP